MEPEQNSDVVLKEKEPSVWNTVTPFSKYLAMILFVALPFIGGWIGYTFAPEKVVEVERIVEVEKSEAAQEDGDVFQPGNFKYLDSYYISFIEDKIYLSKIVFGGLETLQEIDWDRVRVRELDSDTQQFITEYDINYDGLKDLGVPVNTRENQVLYEFYVFDPESERLIKVTDFEGPGPAAILLTNPTFDVASQTITSEFHTKDEIIFTQYKFNGSKYVMEKTWSDTQRTTQTQVVKETKYSLTFNGNLFHISSIPSGDIEENVLFESDKQIYFYLPWFSQDESALRKTDGSKVNNKYYFDIWTQTSNEPIYEWELAEYDPITSEFRILLDSEYLQLDETYNRDKAMSLAPSGNLSNDLGHIVFRIVLCTECGPGPQHYGVLNYETLEFTIIGRATQIEWVDSSTIRYKTESEYGVSKLDEATKEFLKQHENECIDHPINCFQQVDWEQVPWQEVSI